MFNISIFYLYYTKLNLNRTDHYFVENYTLFIPYTYMKLTIMSQGIKVCQKLIS